MGRRLQQIKQHKKKIIVAVVVLIAITLAAKYGGDPKQWMGKARAFASEAWGRTNGNIAKFKAWAKGFIQSVKRDSSVPPIPRPRTKVASRRRKSRKSRKRRRGPSRRRKRSKKSKRRC